MKKRRKSEKQKWDRKHEPIQAAHCLSILILLSVFICVHLWFSFPSLCLRASVAKSYAPRRERIASAASFARSPRSPTGPTHDGHPFSHGHAAISSRVFVSSN